MAESKANGERWWNVIVRWSKKRITWLSGVIVVALITAIIERWVNSWPEPGHSQRPMIDDPAASDSDKLFAPIGPPPGPPNSNPPQIRSPNIPDVEVAMLECIPQDVNQKYRREEFREGLIPVGSDAEAATFRFRIQNNRTAPLMISHAEFVIGSIEVLEWNGAETAFRSRINHDGHVQAKVYKPEVGDAIPVQISATIAPEVSREPIIWIRHSNANDSMVYKLMLRLRVYFNDGEYRDSEIFPAEIHSHL